MIAALKVISAGIHTTIQDLGRHGYQALGVPVSGALDIASHRLANHLVGNLESVPTLEILYQGPVLEVMADSVRVGIAGADAEIELMGDDSRALGSWRSILLHRHQIFRVHRLAAAACCYLAVEGGFAIELCLGSASTYVRGGFGGLAGRALQAGDILPLLAEVASDRTELGLRSPHELGRERPIRVVLGPQQDHFTDAAIQCLLDSQFTVSKSADRMGMRLDGPALKHRDGYNIVSDGIATGAIQVPGSEQPILLLADHQTTGGYPKIATVISADIPVVGRRRPGDSVRFMAVDVAEAERLCRQEEAAFQARIKDMISLKATGSVDVEKLFEANLISGVVFDEA